MLQRMNGRRRFTRYVPFVPPSGRARIVSDCVVERWDRKSAVVVTDQPAERDHEFVMQFTSPTGATTLYPVRVVSCTPDPRQGPMRFRLHVQLTPQMTAPTDGAPAPRGSDQG